MSVSIVICTWNRCASLRGVLDSLRSLVVPADQSWELLVVNNNSSDATDEVLAEYRDILPLRRLFVRQVGLSRARNVAMRAAQGDLVLFTDDDVQVHPQWLLAHVAAARRWPNAGYFAGAIHPRFSEGVPAWVERNQTALAGMLCTRDLGADEHRLRSSEFPYGPNMSVRRDALAGGSFDERVGRRGHEQVRGGESSLFWAMRRQGVWGVWAPAAVVEHHIPTNHANVGYLWGYYHGCGRSQVRLAAICKVQPRLQILLAPLRETAKSLRWFWVWSRHLATLAWLSGQLSELMRLALHRDLIEAEPAEYLQEYS